MKAYVVAFGVGLLIGAIYKGFGVRSPAPPMVALVGLLGILLGEMFAPKAMHIFTNPAAAIKQVINLGKTPDKKAIENNVHET